MVQDKKGVISCERFHDVFYEWIWKINIRHRAVSYIQNGPVLNIQNKWLRGGYGFYQGLYIVKEV